MMSVVAQVSDVTYGPLVIFFKNMVNEDTLLNAGYVICFKIS